MTNDSVWVAFNGFFYKQVGLVINILIINNIIFASKSSNAKFSLIFCDFNMCIDSVAVNVITRCGKS